MEYLKFIESKQKNTIKSGFEIDENALNQNLFPFQKFIVKRALHAGKYAIFADCGLGKTLMQLEWANQVVQYTKQPVLILAPLAVSGQTIKEGEKFNIKVWKWIDNNNAISEDYHSGIPRIWITNYEQLENIDCSIFSGVVLDESSILKNYEGSTKKLILDYFAKTSYKLACTATPSPNDPMELGNHSEFLDVMTRTEMLSMYFIHDGGETSKWRLKGHATKLFYQFVGSWAIMLNNPKDIGFEMHGYDLPKLKLYEKQIATEKRNNGSLFNDTAINATNFNEELRLTKVERLQEACDIVNASKENFIIWIKQNEEGELLKKLIPDAVEVKGSDSPEYKEKMLLGFANNKFRVLITKTKIAQFGLNYQNCRNQIFASLDFSFEGLYQAIRRSYRFGQKRM
jgi:superfamily II DNA or RNA helicase